MQSPEVHNFPAPESSFNVEKFQGSVPINLNINNFHYNHLLTVILPGSQKVPGILFDHFLEKGIYYKVSELHLEDLVDLKFISSFIRNGKLTLLSINKRIDCDNCIGITPDSKLYLSLSKESYQAFGIQGVLSHFTKKLENRYFVTIDLSDEKLLNNKEHLQRLKSCLRFLKSFTVLVVWEPPKGICPSSIAKYFVDVGYSVKQCIPKDHSYTVKSQLPKPDFTADDELYTSDFVEWLGMIALECNNFEEDTTGYLSNYIPLPTESHQSKNVQCFQVKGFYSSAMMVQSIDKITQLLDDSSEKWVAIYVQGFSDCPVAWGKQEHHYFTNGDNGYIIVFNKDGGLICTHKCSNAKYK